MPLLDWLADERCNDPLRACEAIRWAAATSARKPADDAFWSILAGIVKNLPY